MKILICFVLFALNADLTFSSRILFLFPSPSKSHLIVAQGLSTTLAEKGHDVTVVSPFPLGKTLKNYRDIISPMSDSDMMFGSDIVKYKNPLKLIKMMINTTTNMGQGLLEMPEFKKLLKDEKFDLVIIGVFMNNYLFGVADHFKCPSIMMSVTGAATSLNILFGNPIEPHATPHYFMQPKIMGFFDRLKSFTAAGIDFALTSYISSLQREIYNRYFPSNRYITYDQALKNISMLFLNQHFGDGKIRPNVPSVVEIGGIQIKPNNEKLPQDIQQWIDGATDGIIYFSLGSNAKTTHLNNENIEVIFKVFSKLKQRVIMKWDSDIIEEKPENVFTAKWLPQEDILANPATKLFISHGGLGSVIEAKYYGIPIVGLIFVDRIGIINTIVNEGWAAKVDLETLSEKSLGDAIQEILTNEKYSVTAKKLSQLYRDRPMIARETATFWVEYVIRHNGARHMRYQAADQNFLQRQSLDVIGFLIAVIYITVKSNIFIGKFILRKICRKILKNNSMKKQN